jgi:hypothetical protein
MAAQTLPPVELTEVRVPNASPPRRDAELGRASLKVATASPHMTRAPSQLPATVVAPEVVPPPRPEPKPTARPIEAAKRVEVAAAPLDLAVLKQAGVQAVGLLPLARARPADPIPLVAAAAALASSAGAKPSARNDTGPDAGPSSAIAPAGRDLEPAMTGLRLCRKVMGLGAFESMDRSQLRPGQPALLYCERTGLGYEEKGGVFISRLASRVELVSAADGKMVWELSLGEARDESKTIPDTCYVNYRMNLPRSITPGDYRLRLIQTDPVADRTLTSELPVTFIR